MMFRAFNPLVNLIFRIKSYTHDYASARTDVVMCMWTPQNNTTYDAL